MKKLILSSIILLASLHSHASEDSFKVGSHVTIEIDDQTVCDAVVVTLGDPKSQVEFSEDCSDETKTLKKQGEREWIENDNIIYITEG